jgi:superfamily II DNA or RNA helicase
MGATVSDLSRWQQGARVRVRGRRWRVDAVTRGEDCTALRLRELDTARALTLLAPFDRTVTLERSEKPRKVRPRRWMHELDRALVDIWPFGALAAMARSATTLLPYQLEPALAMLRHGATRVLVADGVGLGKTIEAGIVLLELATRSDTFRAIVLVPAGLREQWSAELAAHFHVTARQANASWLRESASQLPPDVNPWSLPGIYIASHDFVKRPEALRSIEDVTWDLAIVDEAHAASAGTDRRTAIHALACRSRRVMLLTATPHAGDEREFRSLCDIGRIHDTEPSITLFARTRADVETRRPRKSLVLTIQPSDAERHMHRLLERYSRQVWKEAGARGDERARLVSIILRKRALSGAGSLLSSVRRRMELLGQGHRTEAEQLPLPLGPLHDEDPLEDDEPRSALAIPGLDDPVRERRWLAAIAEAARTAARGEMKNRALIRLLRRIRQPAIVFTEYRDTLVQIQRGVTALERPVVLLHGGLSPAERTRATQTFNRGEHTLLATDAAAEGLNLHHHCRLVIHYELPWNPARLEQRAGRVDRLGQARRVHEIALVASDTAERLVIAPLAARAAHTRAAPGVSPLLDALSESDVAQAVMEGHEPRLARSAPLPAPVPVETLELNTEAQAEVERLVLERRWRGRSARDHARRDGRLPVVSTPTRRRSSQRTGALLIYLLAIDDHEGSRIHGEALPFHVVDAAGSGVLDDRMTQILDRHARDSKARIARLDARVRAAIADRDSAIDSVRSSAAQMLVQQDLFDRRVARRPYTSDAPLLATTATARPVVLHVTTTLLAVLYVRA